MLKVLKPGKKHPQVVTVAGTRPEIIKLAELVPLLNRKYEHALLYTGQHFSENMKDIFFEELNLVPDYDLKSKTSDIGILKDNLVKVLNELRPRYVIVYGDTNSSMAAALAAEQIKCKLIHMEAGIRDFDLAVPEESIRIHIDSKSDYLFTPSDLCSTVLTYEQIRGQVHTTGNLIVDVCKRLYRVAMESDYTDNHERKGENLEGAKLTENEDFLLLTIHRPENSDDPKKLQMLKKHLEEVRYDVIFPEHPRTKQNLARFGVRLPLNVKIIDAVGYLEFLASRGEIETDFD
jgi:UDP-GlcNAc3NAcA epimerase